MIGESDFDYVAARTRRPLGRTLPIVLEVFRVPVDRACGELFALRQVVAVKHVVFDFRAVFILNLDRLINIFSVFLDSLKTCDICGHQQTLVAVFVEICLRAQIDFLLSGLDEDLIAVFGRCAAYRIDDRICHIAFRILEIGCERVLAARSERDSHEVGKFRHILGTVGIDVDSQCLFGIIAVYVVVSLHGLRLRFLVVGDVNGDCVKHDIERVAVHITCKTSAVCVFGSCRGQIDGCRIPNDLRTDCVFVRSPVIIGLHLITAEIDREFDVCVLREYRCVEERAVAKRDRHRRTVRPHCIARSCCRIVYYDFGWSGNFVSHLFCAFRIVEVQQA